MSYGRQARLAAQESKACREPLRNAYLDRIRVDPALTGDEQFDCPGATFEPDTAFDFVAGLIAPILAAVDTEIANIRRRQQTR